MRTQGPKAAHWNVGAPQHAAERVPLSKPQKLRNERTPSRDGGGDIARRTEHHGGVVELRRGSVRTPRCQPSRARRWGRAAAIERDCDHNCIPTPRTAVYSSAGALEKPAMLTRRASTAMQPLHPSRQLLLFTPIGGIHANCCCSRQLVVFTLNCCRSRPQQLRK